MNKLNFPSFCFREFTRRRLVLVWGATTVLLTTLGQALGTEATYVYRATATQFVLTTKPATVTGPPVLANPGWSGGAFGFDLLTASGQTVTVVSSTNLATPLATWPILLTTNSPGTQIHISDPRSLTSPTLFYRARNGN